MSAQNKELLGDKELSNSRTEQISYALQVAGEGWKLLPANCDKRPLIKNWPNVATDDQEKIIAWSKQYPACNFAVACGRRSGLVVLDVDVKNGRPGLESYRSLIGVYGKLETLVVQTPSGGHHVYLRYPENSISIASKSVLDRYEGIEVKSDGTCVILHGSVLSDGRIYQILKRVHVAEPPNELIELLSQSRNANLPIDSGCTCDESIIEGERNSFLTRLAGTMRQKGMGFEAIHAAISIENEERCSPPLLADEVESISKSILRYAPGHKENRKTHASLLVELASNVDLFSDGHEAFAAIGVGDHLEHWALRKRDFRAWLRHQFYLVSGKVPGSQAIEDAINTLEGRALFDGPKQTVYTRISGDDNTIYIDLADDSWQVVKVTPSTWNVVASSEKIFRRQTGMAPLPYPERGGTVDLLRNYINIGRSEDWCLLISWLIYAFRPTGPYPILILHGEQGSAKSTTARLIRSLIDPNMAPLRSEPRDIRDLVISAKNSWCLSFDNMSHLPPWLSDGLCRLSTGSGFSTRTLFSNEEETIFYSQRPIILNGIEDLATRGDLLDRSLTIYLPRIHSNSRMTESELNRRFEKDRSQIFGSLLDVLSKTLDRIRSVSAADLPRMADFARWSIAAEIGLGFESGSFIKGYKKNQNEANELALEATPVSAAVQNLRMDWVGTATELLELLNSQASENLKKRRGWPKSPRLLSNILRRIKPNLLATGTSIEWFHDGRQRNIAIRKVAN